MLYTTGIIVGTGEKISDKKNTKNLYIFMGDLDFINKYTSFSYFAHSSVCPKCVYIISKLAYF